MTERRHAFEARARLHASTFGSSVQEAPALSWLAATAALAAVAIERVAAPLLGDPARRDLLVLLGRAGDFATNLAALSALVALGIALVAFTRHNPMIDLPRRLLLAGFSGVLLPTLLVATVLERARTTIELVLFALGAAYAVSALVNASAAGRARTWFDRALAAVASTMATAALIAQGLYTLSRTQLDAWVERGHDIARTVTEVGYLVLLPLVAVAALPDRSSPRNRRARLSALFALPVVLGAFFVAEKTLGKDYALALYDAQRVHLFVDRWPRLYAMPLALALTGTFGGVLGKDAPGRQAGAAAALIVASGCAPLAPGRLLTLTLGLLLVARVVAARSERRRASATAPERRDGVADSLAGAADHVRGDGIAEP